jgi:hypothetical protein
MFFGLLCGGLDVGNFLFIRPWNEEAGLETCMNTRLYIQHGLGKAFEPHDRSRLSCQRSVSSLLARRQHSLPCNQKPRASKRYKTVWNSQRYTRLCIQAELPLFPTDQPCSRLAVTRFSVVAAPVIDWMVQPPFLLKGLKFDPDADEGFIFLHTSTSALAKRCHLLRRGGRRRRCDQFFPMWCLFW